MKGWGMRIKVTTTRLDRPWHRPGALSYALARLPGLLRPPVTVSEPANPPGAIRIGTAGTALPGVKTLAGDGELLVRGPTLMSGYHHDPAKTADAMDADGWLRTGDLATIDDAGYVRISGARRS